MYLILWVGWKTRVTNTEPTLFQSLSDAAGIGLLFVHTYCECFYPAHQKETFKWCQTTPDRIDDMSQALTRVWIIEMLWNTMIIARPTQILIYTYIQLIHNT
jgi:hypothetical protein